MAFFSAKVLVLNAFTDNLIAVFALAFFEAFLHFRCINGSKRDKDSEGKYYFHHFLDFLKDNVLIYKYFIFIEIEIKHKLPELAINRDYLKAQRAVAETF